MNRGNGGALVLGALGLGGVLAAIAAASRPGVRQAVQEAAGHAADRAREAATDAREAVREAVTMIDDWMTTLIRKTSAHEGTYWSVQRNLDGNGVSYGILQWTQLGGGLYTVLSRMRAADPAAFDAAFGGSAAALALLAHVKEKNMGPLQGALLWNEPWLSRFRAAGKVASLQAAMWQAAIESDYMQAAVDIARLLGVSTERAMVVYYNRTVHQGAGGALKAARQLADYYARNPGSRPATATGVLAQYGWICAAPFRRTTPPESMQRSKTTEWKEVSSEHDIGEDGKLFVRTGRVWHAFTGPWDLWELILKRTAEILADPELRDQPVALPAPPVA